MLTRLAKATAAAIRTFRRRLQARYEGAQPGGGRRSYIPAFLQDARFDADGATRSELVRKSRYFERNSALMNAFCDRFEQFTVGSNGLQLTPASTDEEWNLRATEWWSEWCQFPDLTSLQPLSSIQSLIARTWFVDGEVFILKTKGATGLPRIQLIESHRVGTPPRQWDQEGRLLVDGVEVDKRGRPAAYWVRDGFDFEDYRRIPAESIIHVFEPPRPGMYRGLPFIYPVINDLHDLDDLQMLEMQAAKNNARIDKVIESVVGEVDAEDLIQGDLTGPDGANITKYYEAVFGAESKVIRAGDKYHHWESNRPTVASREYWEYLTSKVCAGVGISKLLIFPWSIQGTVARADFDIANAFFRSRSGVMISILKELWIYVIGLARFQDMRVADAPHDWTKVTVQPPRAVNVDVGRNSAAMLAELEAGATTYEDVYGPLGENWRERIRQRAAEESYLDQVAREFGVSPERIRKAIGETLRADMEAQAQEREKEETVEA